MYFFSIFSTIRLSPRCLRPHPRPFEVLPSPRPRWSRSSSTRTRVSSRQRVLALHILLLGFGKLFGAYPKPISLVQPLHSVFCLAPFFPLPLLPAFSLWQPPLSILQPVSPFFLLALSGILSILLVSYRILIPASCILLPCACGPGTTFQSGRFSSLGVSLSTNVSGPLYPFVTVIPPLVVRFPSPPFSEACPCPLGVSRAPHSADHCSLNSFRVSLLFSVALPRLSSFVPSFSLLMPIEQPIHLSMLISLALA